MKRIIALIATQFFIFTVLWSQIITPEWTTILNIEVASQGDLPIILIDSAKNVIVCSGKYHPGPLIDFHTAKYNTDGQLLWQKDYQTSGQDRITTAAVDGSNNIYVGGTTRDIFTGNVEFVLFKYNHNGDYQWEYRYTEGTAQGITIAKVKITENDEVLLAGSFVNPDLSNAGLLAVKLDSLGNVIWQSLFDENDYGYQALDIILSDTLMVWGRVSTPDGLRFVSWQLDQLGQTIESNFSEPYNDDFGNEFHVDEYGNLYIGDGYNEYKVIKFAKNAEKKWQYQKQVPANPGGVTARSLAIQTHASNSIYVTGIYYDVDSASYYNLTSKLDSNGQLIWSKSFSIPGFLTSFPDKSVVSEDGTFYMTGSVYTDFSNNYYQHFIVSFDSIGNHTYGVISLNSNSVAVSGINIDDAFVYTGGIIYTQNPQEPNTPFLCKTNRNLLITSLASNQDTERVKLFPNPFFETLNMVIPELEISFSMVNIAGNKVIDGILRNPNGHHVIPNLQNLPSGIYTIQVTAGNKRYIGKAVKTN